MRFQPKTEKEIAEANLLPKGQYDAEIVKGEDKTSAKGNEMIELQLKLYNQDGDYHGTIFDYLLESIAYKLRHAAAACDLLHLYEKGELNASDFEGKCVRVDLVIQKDRTGQYSDKNSIKDYLPPVTVGPDQGKTSQRQSAPVSQFDDDIPF